MLKKMLFLPPMKGEGVEVKDGMAVNMEGVEILLVVVLPALNIK